MLNTTTILEAPKEIFSKFIKLPEIGPFLPSNYSIVFFALFVLTLLLARFLKLKRLIMLILITSITGLLFGGTYVAAMSFAILLPLCFILKLKKGEGKFGKIGKGEKFDFKEEGEFKMPEMKEPEIKEPELGEEFKMPEEKMPQTPTQPQQKLCPCCGSPLTYIPQYQRYYCYKCRRYI